MKRGVGMGLAAVSAAAPTVVPEAVSGGGGLDRDDQWRSFDSNVNAVSFGFVATAVLISMFLIMAIFERLVRPRSSDAVGGEADIRKLHYPSPKMTVYPRGVSVLMPGEQVPTFLAHPAPQPCPPDRISPA